MDIKQYSPAASLRLAFLPTRFLAVLWVGILIVGCEKPPAPPKLLESPIVDTCSQKYPSYWQDSNPNFIAMRAGQRISNVPPQDWNGPVFRLSDRYPQQAVDDRQDQLWRASKFDSLFMSETKDADQQMLAMEYAWLVMHYLQEGNLSQGDGLGLGGKKDWDVCQNSHRPWFHLPFQTYDALSGREFVHGLRRESLFSLLGDPSDPALNSTQWSVSFYNATAAYTLGRIWRTDDQIQRLSADLSFDEGSVIGKPVFNTLNPKVFPMLMNMPVWQANISDPKFCTCTVKPSASKVGIGECTLIEESHQCPRMIVEGEELRLWYFDLAVKDHRAAGTQWVVMRFVADGQRKSEETNPWMRISLLGLSWDDAFALNHRAQLSSKNLPTSFEGVIVWHLLDELKRSKASGRMATIGYLPNFRQDFEQPLSSSMHQWEQWQQHKNQESERRIYIDEMADASMSSSHP